MKTIPREQVLQRLTAENAWWTEPHKIQEAFRALRRRQYIRPLLPLVQQRDVKRAVLLMGPRRVGKTVLLHHVITALLDDDVPPRQICYISVDHPIYNGCGLAELLEAYADASGADLRERTYVFFDEIQYLKDWELHLKTLVDANDNVKFVASGSAAAALRLKSTESGAGRFTEFLLPPVTFAEYVHLLQRENLIEPSPAEPSFRAPDIHALNASFVHYLNFGGYPEVIFSEAIQADPARFIKSDIIDKVLLRDLPGLYGIQDIQELNYLFTTLAFNSAGEVSLDQLSQHSGVAKNTIKRYIEYLEAAFLIKVVHRIDRNAKRFQRANFFKVYLTNPSIRSALFSPISAGDEAIGGVVETGIFAQWFHSSEKLHYARWEQGAGEVDIVGLSRLQRPKWAVEVKWSDRYVDHPRELKSLLSFCARNELSSVVVTTRTLSSERVIDGVTLRFIPASLYCYAIGHHVLNKPSFRTESGNLPFTPVTRADSSTRFPRSE